MLIKMNVIWHPAMASLGHNVLISNIFSGVFQGDSGGPLVVVRQADGILCLAGLTSYGHSCALPELPGVYTNVEKYVDWIRERSGGENQFCWV